MDARIGEVERDRLKNENRFLRLLVVGLGAFAVLTTALTFYALSSQTTLLLPSAGGKPYVLGRGLADREYLGDLAYDVLALWGNVTPENIVYAKERLLKLSDGEGNTGLRNDLDLAEKRIKQDVISTVWSPRDYEVDMDKKIVTVDATGRPVKL